MFKYTKLKEYILQLCKITRTNSNVFNSQGIKRFREHVMLHVHFNIISGAIFRKLPVKIPLAWLIIFSVCW